MRWTVVIAGAWWVALAQAGAAQAPLARVSGRITILEKRNKPSRDLGSAVAYLDGGAAPARVTAVEIVIADKEFVPRVVVVPVGSTVRFPNHDPFDHNVFSVSEGAHFDLGQYGRGEARAWTFTTRGLVRVFCNVHPRMVAFVQVMPTRQYTQPGADGSFTLEDVPPGRYTLRVWHERSAEVARELVVGPAGVSDLEVELDARGFRWLPHKNKYGDDYPTDAARERY